MIVTHVQYEGVRQGDVEDVTQAAMCQAKRHKVKVTVEPGRRHHGTAGVNVAELRVQVRRKRVLTHSGQTLTPTPPRTADVTQQLVVTARTLEDPVTQVMGMQTHRGVTTAVEAWTGEDVAPRLVLPARAVVDSVAHNVHRQAVETRAQEVGIWAPCPGWDGNCCDETTRVEVYHSRRWGAEQKAIDLFIAAAVFVRSVRTVLGSVTSLLGFKSAAVVTRDVI